MNVPLDWEHSKANAGRTVFVNTETSEDTELRVSVSSLAG
jgi:hypothetical protein